VTSQAEAVSGGRRGRTVPGRGQALALATLCTLLFLTFLDNTVVSVALGDIQVSLKANVSDLQWVVGAYALTFASIMLACGMIGDELGRKKVMLAGAGVFCAGSVLCALAPNVQTLIAGRAVMGLGAAASEPGTLSMLRHLYPDARARNRAVGIWAATSGFALAAGPVVGGVLTGLWSWRTRSLMHGASRTSPPAARCRRGRAPSSRRDRQPSRRSPPAAGRVTMGVPGRGVDRGHARRPRADVGELSPEASRDDTTRRS